MQPHRDDSPGPQNRAEGRLGRCSYRGCPVRWRDAGSDRQYCDGHAGEQAETIGSLIARMAAEPEAGFEIWD